MRADPFVVLTSINRSGPARSEGQNIVARTISIFGGNPSDLPGQVRAVGFSELAPLKINNKLLPGFAKRTVAMVPFHRIKFLDEPSKRSGIGSSVSTVEVGGATKISAGKGGSGRQTWSRLKNGWVLGEVTVYRIEDGVLIVPLGLVAGNPGHAQFIQHSRNVLVLELDGAVRPANLGHEGRTMPGFDIWSPGEIGCEHGEVVGDDRIEFVILPMRPNLRFVSHLSCSSSEEPFHRS